MLALSLPSQHSRPFCLLAGDGIEIGGGIYESPQLGSSVTGIQPVVDVPAVREAVQPEQLGAEWLNLRIIGFGERPSRPRLLRLNCQGREVWPEAVAAFNDSLGMFASLAVVVLHDNYYENSCTPQNLGVLTAPAAAVWWTCRIEALAAKALD